MSFLNLTELRSKNDYDVYINDVTVHQSDPAHPSHLTDNMNKLQHLTKMIMNHFNNTDLEEVDPSKIEISLYIKDISEANRLLLEISLINKGYTVEYINNFEFIVISS